MFSNKPMFRLVVNMNLKPHRHSNLFLCFFSLMKLKPPAHGCLLQPTHMCNRVGHCCVINVMSCDFVVFNNSRMEHNMFHRSHLKTCTAEDGVFNLKHILV